MSNLTTEEIILFLRENGSINVQQRMNEINGEQYCASYIERHLEKGASLEDAWGWLESDLSEIYNN